MRITVSILIANRAHSAHIALLTKHCPRKFCLIFAGEASMSPDWNRDLHVIGHLIKSLILRDSYISVYIESKDR